ncbi:MAG: helix-turn-helix type 11 domain protein [Myxococcaceae bacterium]|nr:helix-turn-helix type 11 domain protein [Myxococcaceae bacterium]
MPVRRRSGPGRKRGAYSQAERILRLYAALLEGRIVRVAEFAEELGISARQVQRDLAVVRGHLGERLAQRPDGAWVVQRAIVSEVERGSARTAILGLAIGAKLSSSLWGERAARRLRARVDGLISGLGDSLASRFDGWHRRIAVVAPGQKDYAGRSDVARRLEAMLEALIHCRVVRLSYRSHPRAMKGLPARDFVVHTLGLIHYRDGVYFVVDVTSEGGVKETRERRILLALDRIGDLAFEGASFTVPRGFDAQAFLGEAFGIWREGAVEDVEIEVEAAHARWVLERRIHPSQQVEERTDGSLLVRLRVDGLHEVTDWVLSLGEYAEVIRPPALRERVATRLRAAAARYG